MYRVSSTKTACPRAQLCAVKIFKIAVFSNPERKPMHGQQLQLAFKSAGEALTGLRQNYFQNKSF